MIGINDFIRWVISRALCGVLPAVLLLTTGCVRARAPQPGETAPIREVTLVVDAEVSGIPDGAKELRLWIPVPRDDGAQVLTRLSSDSAANAVVVTDSRRGNAALLLVRTAPSWSERSRVTVDVARADQRGAGASHPLAHVEKRGNPEAWLESESGTTFAPIASRVFSGHASNAAKARAAWDFVLAEMPEGCRGFVELMRAGGVPARARDGYRLPPDEREGTLSDAACWAEWWDPERGWMPVDPARKIFGTIDRDRIGVSLGRDLAFDGLSGAPVDGFARPFAEVDGRPVHVVTTVTFRDR